MSNFTVRLEEITDLWTHTGKFHADDVLAYAALRMMGCTGTLHRVNQLPDNLGATDLAFDIGEGKFDHHQPKRQIRSNGVPYAAFGLIMKEFYQCIGLDFYEYVAMDRGFIKHMDGTDTAFFHGNPLSSTIATFNPEWDKDISEEAQMEAFMEAAAFAEIILEKQIRNIKAKSRAKKLVSLLEETAEYHCIFMDKYAPVSSYIKNNPDIHWTCYCSSRGDWAIDSVSGPRNTPKAVMPKEFWGASADLLPEGMLYCNRNGTKAVFSSLLSARLFAKRYLANAERFEGAAADVTDDDDQDC